MDKKKFSEKVEKCRAIADDILSDAYDLKSSHRDRAECVYQVGIVLDTIDSLLNYLKGGNAEDTNG